MAIPPRLCVVGSANVDLTFRTSRLPQPGETLAGKAFHLGFGGKGANQAVTAARLGAAVALVARLGDDAFGRESLRHLQAEGLDVANVRFDAERSTGVAAIVVDDQARNCILVVPGANFGLSAGNVRDARSAIETAEVLLCQMEVPVDTTLEAFRVARAAGVRTILNPAPATSLPVELIALTDLCVLNETELETLSSMPAVTLEQVEAGARSLQRSGARAVIVTLGARGALLLEGSEVLYVPALPVEAVDPTAAGDAFIGALAVFWSEGRDLREAARNANAIAALTVTRHGAQASLPTRAEADAFLAR